MAITKEYDKFDNKWEFVTSLHTLSNTDPRIGVVSTNFAYVIGEGFEIGWLILYRNGKRWQWLSENRAVVVADGLRVEHNGGLRENEILDGGNVYERIDIAFTPEQTQLIADSNDAPACRVDGVVYEFTPAFVAEIKEVLAAVINR